MTKGNKSHTLIKALMILIIAIAVGVATFFGIQYFTKTGIFHVPGKIIYGPDTAGLQELISDKLDNVELNNDITISTYDTNTKTSDEMLYNIHVLVTDFYNPKFELDEADYVDTFTVDDVWFISISELNNQVKLLNYNDSYYLDTFDSGAIFEYISVTGDDSTDVDKVKNIIQELLPTFPSKDTVLTFAQTGVTALSRGMNAMLDKVGDASYFAANIGDFLSSFDLTHTSNEASFSEYANSRNICAKPSMLDTLTAIGLDIVELTGNHNQDCGDEAALNTLQIYQELSLQTVGGGESAVAAAEPLLIDQKDTNITMLAYNLSTGGYTLDDTPGANFYTAEKATADIAAAKARGDFIIVDIQYYECNGYADEIDNPTCDRADSAAGDQVGFFRELIDMGADIVVGTAAHQPQTYELYGNGVIYYGLGNLFFDQIWWPGTQRSLILIHYFYEGKLLQTRIVPTVYGDEMQVQLMDAPTATWFIDRLNQVRPN